MLLLDYKKRKIRKKIIVAFLLTFLMVVEISVAAQQYTLKPTFRDVIVDIGGLKSGKNKSGKMVVIWGRTVVWIIKRTEEEIKALEKADVFRLGAPQGEDWKSQFEKAFNIHPQLPNLLELEQLTLERSPYRSQHKDIFVMIPMSPYTGCLLSYKPMDTKQYQLHFGFYDSCSREKYDLAGRIFKNSLRNKFWNLYIPPHKFLDKDKLLIGIGNPPRTLSSTDYAPKIDYSSMKPIPRLIEAAKWGKINLVKKLLDSGLDVESSVGLGVTPLLVASTRGHNNVIQLLIDRGALVNKPNDYGLTPLHGAIAGYRIETVNLLTFYGADVNRICPTPDCNGTPLNFAISWILQEEEVAAFATLLLKQGADPRISYKEKNAFDWACEKGYNRVLTILKSERRMRSTRLIHCEQGKAKGEGE